MKLFSSGSASGGASERNIGIITMFLAGALWGTSGTISRFLPVGATPLTTAWTRSAISGLLLCLIVLRHGRFATVMRSRYALLTGLCVTVNQLGFFLSLDRLGVALSTMLVIASSLIMEGLLDCFFGQRPSQLWWCAAAIGVVGTALIATGGPGASFNLPGLIFGLTGGFGYSLVGIGLKRLRLQGFDGLECNAAAMLYAAAAMFPFAASKLAWLATPEAIVPALALGAVSMAIPYCLFTVALIRISVSQAYAIGLMEPLTAGVLGLCLLGERISVPAAFGMGALAICMAMSAVDAMLTESR